MDTPNGRLYSGATAEQVRKDLSRFVDFKSEGICLVDINKMINEKLVPHLMKYDSPGFLSMFNTLPESGAMLGAAAALEYNQGVTNWQVSPGGAMLEELCCKALCRLFGLSDNADATFMYCGTYANQAAIYLALHKKAEDEGFDLAQKGVNGFKVPSDLALITTYDAHFSVRHAVRMLGLGEESLVFVNVDKHRRMDIDHLQSTIKSIRGHKDIFCVLATAGTTSAGAVDPVLEIARICKENDIWLHADGAYGLAYSLIPGKKQLFEGIELADSLSWDPHKQSSVSIPNSVLFVRNSDDFKRMCLFSDYFNRDETEPNPGLKSPPSTRPFSALVLCTSLLHQGMDKYVSNLNKPLNAIRQLYDLLKEDSETELMHEPDTGVLCFRIIPESVPEDSLNDLQEYIYETIMAKGESTVSLSAFDTKKVLRILSVNPKITFIDFKTAIQNIKAVAGSFIS